jgi:hypothetical protein
MSRTCSLKKGYDLGSSGEGEEEREAGNSVVKEPGLLSFDSVADCLVVWGLLRHRGL